jgi:ribosomal protein S18 acetylase RimI-like enzyme
VTEIRTATPDDTDAVVLTAARALDGEAMLRWSFGEEGFEERIRRHFAHYDGENIRRGWVRLADAGTGFAVWIPPEGRAEHEAIGPAPADDPTILGDHADRHASFWTWVGDHEPDEPLWYLSHIAVAPDHQRRGLGSALMRDGIETAERSALPIWLETSRAENAVYYERFGFRTVVDEDAPQGGPRIWFMRRDPA